MNKTDVAIVFTNGFMFLGKFDALKVDTLANAVSYKENLVMTANGPAIVPSIAKSEDIVLGAGYSYSFLESDRSVYRDYMKLVSGLDIPVSGTQH